jgi:beta-phosphoglucomutase-like phosphatase (HAD superfamily)
LEFVGPLVGGDMVDRPKPDPQAYLKLADALGVDPRQCVVFEDSDFGVRAGVASGARVVQVPDMITPSDDVSALGHLIAPSLLDGAVMAGIIDRGVVGDL